jgi:extracellular factor (EF) 3-hydroxypalmitic acid methyl ester biosynthesis protein
VLNLGSGPCRDLAEFLASEPEAELCVDCVDQDPSAIAYAQGLVGRTHSRAAVRFIQANVLRFRPERHYDLVWSAGLFDYLPDRLFVQVLSRLLRHVRPGGRLVVGNFAPGHETQLYMELVGDWVLTYRTGEQLIDLALAAGADRDTVRVEAEPEGVNLFLVAHG